VSARRRPAASMNRRQKREVDELSRFIDAHGGRLGAFRGYGVMKREMPADMKREMPAERSTEEPGSAEVERGCD
jgi:hypothetical protein